MFSVHFLLYKSRYNFFAVAIKTSLFSYLLMFDQFALEGNNQLKIYATMTFIRVVCILLRYFFPPKVFHCWTQIFHKDRHDNALLTFKGFPQPSSGRRSVLWVVSLRYIFGYAVISVESSLLYTIHKGHRYNQYITVR